MNYIIEIDDNTLNALEDACSNFELDIEEGYLNAMDCRSPGDVRASWVDMEAVDRQAHTLAHALRLLLGYAQPALGNAWITL